MGYGSYSLEAHQAIVAARDPATMRFASVFDPKMNPLGKPPRESRDSAEHPNSLSIVFALDVSTSMGAIPKSLAAKTLPTFMEATMAFVPSPQILFMAFGDARYWRGSWLTLQVGQFESEAALMDRWLAATFIPEGDSPFVIPPAYIGESYDLAMYYAARHTAMDCLQKRGKRGYFFMTGDEPPFAQVDAEHVRAVIDPQAQTSMPLHALVAELERSFEPFFLIPDPARAARDDCARVYRRLFHERCIVLEDADDTAVVAATLIGIGERALTTRAEIEARVEAAFDRHGEARDRVVRAVLPYAEALARGHIAAPEPVSQRTDCPAAAV